VQHTQIIWADRAIRHLGFWLVAKQVLMSKAAFSAQSLGNTLVLSQRLINVCDRSSDGWPKLLSYIHTTHALFLKGQRHLRYSFETTVFDILPIWLTYVMYYRQVVSPSPSDRTRSILDASAVNLLVIFYNIHGIHRWWARWPRGQCASACDHGS
jgi:hypothetical protein